MLKRDHILNLKIDRTRLEAHQNIADMGLNRNRNTSRIEAIGNAALGSILDVDPIEFQHKLTVARSKRVSYLVKCMRGIIGISPATSVVKDGNILSKNMIIPSWRVMLDPGLSDHYLVAVFVRGHKNDDGQIEYDPDSVQIAGWTDVNRLLACATHRVPAKFETDLRVTVLPCRYLEPIDTLIKQLSERIEEHAQVEEKPMCDGR